MLQPIHLFLYMNKPKVFQWLAELCRLIAAILAGWGGANL